jgi:hypothetical protein
MRILGGILRSKVVLIAVIILVATLQVPAQAQERSRAQVYALEGLGALGGCVGSGCLAVGGVAMFVAAGEQYSSGEQALAVVGLSVLAVSAAVMPAAAGYGAANVGDRLGEYGSLAGAIGGAYVGAVVGAGLSYGLASASSQTDEPQAWTDWAHTLAPVVAALAANVGAVVGYNLGAPHETGPFGSRNRGRLELPAVALTSAKRPDRSVEYGVKVQLAGLRF